MQHACCGATSAGRRGRAERECTAAIRSVHSPRTACAGVRGRARACAGVRGRARACAGDVSRWGLATPQSSRKCSKCSMHVAVQQVRHACCGAASATCMLRCSKCNMHVAVQQVQHACCSATAATCMLQCNGCNMRTHGAPISRQQVPAAPRPHAPRLLAMLQCNSCNVQQLQRATAATPRVRTRHACLSRGRKLPRAGAQHNNVCVCVCVCVCVFYVMYNVMCCT